MREAVRGVSLEAASGPLVAGGVRFRAVVVPLAEAAARAGALTAGRQRRPRATQPRSNAHAVRLASTRLR